MFDERTRQIIRYRGTATLPPVLQYTASKEGGYKTNGNIIELRQSKKRCTRRTFQKIFPHQGC